MSTVKFLKEGQTRRWFNDEAEIRLVYSGRHVAHIVYTGYLSDAFADPIVETAEMIVADLAPVHLFSDITALTGNAPRMRMIVTKWTWANRHHFRSYNVLMKPGLVGTTMAAISLRLGGFVNLWTNPAAFDKAIKRAAEMPAGI